MSCISKSLSAKKTTILKPNMAFFEEHSSRLFGLVEQLKADDVPLREHFLTVADPRDRSYVLCGDIDTLSRFLVCINAIHLEQSY